jgi:hypothetical protein
VTETPGNSLALQSVNRLIAIAASQGELAYAIELAAQQEEHVWRRANVEKQLDLKRKGQIYGFIISIAWLIGAVVIGITANPWAGTLLASVDLVPLVAIFVLSRMPEEKKKKSISSKKKQAAAGEPRTEES